MRLSLSDKRSMDIDLARSLLSQKGFKKMRRFSPGGIVLDYEGTKSLIIRFPRSRIVNILVRAVFLALVIVMYPRLESIFERSIHLQGADSVADCESDPLNLEVLPTVFRDMANDGLLKTGSKALFLGNDNTEAMCGSQILHGELNMDCISTGDLQRQGSIPGNTFDFAFTSDFFGGSSFIDRTLKVGGIVAVPLTNSMSAKFDLPSNYRIIYFRRLSNPILAMRKMGQQGASIATQRRLFGFDSAEKKAALQNLEDVLLEPPRASSGRSRTYQKKTKYLPDLLGDTLESYPRRVFIDVGLPEKDGGSGTAWFAKNYPTRNLHFDMYKIETVTEDSSGKEVAVDIGLSDWLKKNVKEEEFVVMKAEAEAVEEMVMNRAIRLVDELFLECKPKGSRSSNRSRRAYWECLALYGRLRDEGVAVHQWWG